jgi:metallo-beta-lactamase class B
VKSPFALISMLVLAGGMAATTAIGQGPPTDRDFSAEITDAVRTAKEAAGFEHLGTLNRLCVLPPSTGAPSTNDEVPEYITDPSTAPARDSWYADPAQVFDDLYFVGGSQHSSWALTTDDGIILIDTIYPYNSKELILDGMRKVGLDPADIKYVIISHAHADHIGGAEIVQEASDAPVVMGAADWKTVEQFPGRYTNMTPDASTGISVDKPIDLTLGETTVRVIPTPGHTPGTLSYIFEAHDHGRPVTVAYSGGTAFNFQTDLPDPGIANLQQYIDSARMFQQAVVDAGATVLISNHSEFDNAVNKNRMLAGRGDGPHPYENGAESVGKYFDVMIGCARAKQIGLEKVAAGK